MLRLYSDLLEKGSAQGNFPAFLSVRRNHLPQRIP